MYFIYTLSITILLLINIFIFNYFFIKDVMLLSLFIYPIPLFVLNIIQYESMCRFLKKNYYDEYKKLINEFGTVDLVSSRAVEFAKFSDSYNDINLAKLKKDIIYMRRVTNLTIYILIILAFITIYPWRKL